MVDRFLAALHGDDGRRHQQVRQFPYGALAACEQVASHVQRGNWGRGLTLSGTKTHVKQRFLPLTPLLMVSDDLWSPVLPA